MFENSYPHFDLGLLVHLSSNSLQTHVVVLLIESTLELLQIDCHNGLDPIFRHHHKLQIHIDHKSAIGLLLPKLVKKLQINFIHIPLHVILEL